jgi:hypothetical protein
VKLTLLSSRIMKASARSAARKAKAAAMAASRASAQSASPITSTDSTSPEARIVGIDISMASFAASWRA